MRFKAEGGKTMKISNEVTARSYQFTNTELIKLLQIKGTIKSIEFTNGELTIQTLDERTPKENPIKNLFDSIGGMQIGGK